MTPEVELLLSLRPFQAMPHATEKQYKLYFLSYLFSSNVLGTNQNLEKKVLWKILNKKIPLEKLLFRLVHRQNFSMSISVRSLLHVFFHGD